MKITDCPMDDVESLTDIYNAQITHIPYCYPVTPDEFGTGLRCCANEDRPDDSFYQRRILVAVEAGQRIGFADVALVDIGEDEEKRHVGLIRFLTVPLGHRSAGQVLLEEAEDYLRGFGVGEIHAFRRMNPHTYRFYHFAFGMLSDRLTHLYGLFRINGYGPVNGEFFMERPDFWVEEPQPPDDDFEITLSEKFAPGERPDLWVQATRNGERLAHCGTRCASRYCLSDNAAYTFLIWYLGVVEPERGKG